VIIPVLAVLVAAALGWRLWKGRPWAKFGWLQGALLVLTVLIGLWWYSRAKLPYNSEGRWFDEEQMVVSDEGVEEVLRVAFMVSFTAWVISMVGMAKHPD
jgi:ABC-type sulfate transport system permease component